MWNREKERREIYIKILWNFKNIFNISLFWMKLLLFFFFLIFFEIIIEKKRRKIIIIIIIINHIIIIINKKFIELTCNYYNLLWLMLLLLLLLCVWYRFVKLKQRERATQQKQTLKLINSCLLIKLFSLPHNIKKILS